MNREWGIRIWMEDNGWSQLNPDGSYGQEVGPHYRVIERRYYQSEAEFNKAWRKHSKYYLSRYGYHMQPLVREVAPWYVISER